MSKSLFLHSLKSCYKLVLIFAGILALYQGTIIGIADPEDMLATKELFMSFSELMSAFGIDANAMTDILSYNASTFFSTLVMIFCMVFYIIISQKLVAKKIDDGSLAYTLSMPISRRKFIVTQTIFLLLTFVFLFVVIFLTGLLFMCIKADVNIKAYLNLVAVCMLLNMVLAEVVMLVSIIVSTNRRLSMLPAVLPIALLFISIIASLGGESTQLLGLISPFSWIDSVAIVNETISIWWMYIVFIGLIAGLFVSTAIVFEKKRLPL